jgi:CheY-like chemotaxis protein
MAPHVLLVDDSTLVRMVIAAELREAGFLVTPVPTLDAARRALSQYRERGRFDLAVLDLTLPDGDGLDLLRELRRDPSYENLPIMILSGDSRFGSRLRGLGIGADDFVGKPHSKAYLVARARALTGQGCTGAERSGRVLIVDADAGLREPLARLLRVGHSRDVVALENVDEAAQYLQVEGTRIDCAVVERRSFIRLLGLLQGRQGETVPVVVLDDSPAGGMPSSAPRRGTLSRDVSFVPRSSGPSAIAEAVLRRSSTLPSAHSAHHGPPSGEVSLHPSSRNGRMAQGA